MQTKLQCFFKKASDKSPGSTPGQSEDDDGLVVDENGKDNYDDTTLKLEEQDNLDNNNHDDTTLKIEEESDNDDRKGDGNTNTFVINITLQGVPNKNKDKSEETVDIKKEILSPNKIKPTAKRKLHDLFGESDSEEEVTESKKAKADKHSKKNSKDKMSPQESKSIKTERKEPKRTKSDHKDTEKIKKESPDSKKSKTERNDTKKHKKESEESKKHKTDEDEKRKEKKEHERKRRKSSESKNSSSKKGREKDGQKVSSDHSKRKKDVTKESVLGALSDSDSEKELVIDDGTESHTNNNEAEGLISKNTSHSSNDTNNSSVDIDTDDAEHKNDSSEINGPPPIEVDDSKLDKALRLSKEADKVLQALKQFSEMPPEPVVVEKPPDEAKPPLLEPTVTSQSPSKHKPIVDKKSKLSLKNKSKERHNIKDKTKKSDKLKVEKKKVKEEVVAKKTEKVDVAGLVVKSLMPYYKSKQINSRDLFKVTARHIVHQLLAIQVTGKLLFWLYRGILYLC